MMDRAALKDFLDQKATEYNNKSFIETDPIQVPHRYSKKEDIEIAGFLSATIAWGNRKAIIANAFRMMELLDDAPHDFVTGHSVSDLEKLKPFVHRTFNGLDLLQFVTSLKNIYTSGGGMESVFARHATKDSLQPAISGFRKEFFSQCESQRSQKHLSDPHKNSAAKRVNMFLRWMIRKDNAGVDFGIWQSISPKILSCPLDVHSGNIARKLGLLTRKQNDAKAVAELDTALRTFDPHDPAKYDFALFGLGAFEKF